MSKKLTLLVMAGVMSASTALAAKTLPQHAPLAVNLIDLADKAPDIQQVSVEVEMGLLRDNPKWMLNQTVVQVLVSKLLNMPDKPVPEDKWLAKMKAPEESYHGIKLTMVNAVGRPYETITVYNGRVRLPGGRVLHSDYGRQLEYWLFGTARTRKLQMIGPTVMPMLTFEQCRVMGQPVVETTPRQCVLDDGNLILETKEKVTEQSLKAVDFDTCLQFGKALIYSFPRRCMAAGGRVFTEPPRMVEEPVVTPPADAPLVSTTTPVVTPTDGGLHVSSTTPVTPSVVSASSVTSDTMARWLGSIEPAAGPDNGGATYASPYDRAKRRAKDLFNVMLWW